MGSLLLGLAEILKLLALGGNVLVSSYAVKKKLIQNITSSFLMYRRAFESLLCVFDCYRFMTHLYLTSGEEVVDVDLLAVPVKPKLIFNVEGPVHNRCFCIIVS